MRQPITRIPNAVSTLVDESQAESVLRECLLQLVPEVLSDPLIEIEIRDRGGYFAAFVFLSDARLLNELTSKRLEVSELARDFGVRLMLYPQN